MLRKILSKILSAILKLVASVFLIYLASSTLGFFYQINKAKRMEEKAHAGDTLLLDLSKNFHDVHHEGLLQSVYKMGSNNLDLFQLVETLEIAAGDSNIQKLVIKLGEEGISLVQAQELSQAIVNFKAKGKKVYSHIQDSTTGTNNYYLGIHSDKLYLSPFSHLGLTGRTAKVPFVVETLDTIGVKADIHRRKNYKSYPEMFTNKDFSPEHKESLQAVIDSLNNQMSAVIKTQRNLAPEKITDLINEGPYLAQEAQQLKLIDEIGYYDEMLEQAKIDEENLVKIEDYYNWNEYIKKKSNDNLPMIGVIKAEGAIFDNRSPDNPLMSDSSHIDTDYIAKALRSAVENERIKAIVIRLNSPGGSATVADEIRREIMRTRQKGTPVVVSMGQVAASGGYMIACAADKIVAHPGTITGSIGVFTGKFVLQELWQKLKVNWGSINTNKNSDMWSENSAFNEAQMIKINNLLDQIYLSFKKIVAEGRGIELSKVEEIAQGRIWTGEMALEHKLVDSLGGIYDTLKIAKQLAKIPAEEPVLLVQYESETGVLTNFLRSLSGAFAPSVQEAFKSVLRITGITDHYFNVFKTLILSYFAKGSTILMDQDAAMVNNS